MYVPGELASVETVTVDVGTGYYIEKTIPEAREFYKRKEAFLSENLKMLAQTINAKRKNLQGAASSAHTHTGEGRERAPHNGRTPQRVAGVWEMGRDGARAGAGNWWEVCPTAFTRPPPLGLVCPPFRRSRPPVRKAIAVASALTLARAPSSPPPPPSPSSPPRPPPLPRPSPASPFSRPPSVMVEIMQAKMYEIQKISQSNRDKSSRGVASVAGSA